MARTQLLRDWAIEEFGEKECPSYITLLSYAKNKMIYPPPQKAGCYWRVDKGARFVGVIAQPVITPKDDPRLLRILSDGSPTKI
ncbi:excisionase [Yersinia enterocolitica]|uniref:excisionase n=1 Tax=Yersinia enterocolitica TaxID=630 RepID=UPI001C60A26D|nr:excisionase [Yersinia enterocolitica]MBW5823314.1 excisionase [Yersinia enterocolitica]MBW5849078.1 excisionase [Yersinia enterocolitica]MBW5867059.1 excisionase [Yersinia enterocolitica]MBW5874896.1 excisionase [Yersinia enterocolitica]